MSRCLSSVVAEVVVCSFVPDLNVESIQKVLMIGKNLMNGLIERSQSYRMIGVQMGWMLVLSVEVIANDMEGVRQASPPGEQSVEALYVSLWVSGLVMEGSRADC